VIQLRIARWNSKSSCLPTQYPPIATSAYIPDGHYLALETATRILLSLLN
jgi:hypothetical protein